MRQGRQYMPVMPTLGTEVGVPQVQDQPGPQKKPLFQKPTTCASNLHHSQVMEPAQVSINRIGKYSTYLHNGVLFRKTEMCPLVGKQLQVKVLNIISQIQNNRYCFFSIICISQILHRHRKHVCMYINLFLFYLKLLLLDYFITTTVHTQRRQTEGTTKEADRRTKVWG